jgi:ankyrin repeat protein
MWMALMGVLMAAHAADPVQEALQRGLLAEEAQRDLLAAREAYAEAVRQADLQREMSALALFRLAETERLLGNTNVARELFTRLVLRYPDQTNLVQAAKPWVERRSGLPRPVDSVRNGPALATLELQRRTLERQLESWTKLPTRDLAQRLAIDQPSALLNQLLNDRMAAEQAGSALQSDFGPQHPERLKVDKRLQVIDEQLDRVVRAIVDSTRARLVAVMTDIDLLRQLAAEEATESAAAASGAPLDPAELLRQEIALAEQQVRNAEQRLAAGQGSNEEVIKAKREVLALQRQALGRPRVQDLPEGVVSDLGPAAENAPGREEADELARLKKLAAESPDLLRRGDETPLQKAAAKGWTNVVVYLLDLGVPPNDASKSDRATALHRAARAGNLTLATLLLDRGADVNARGNIRETPLHCAVRAGHRAMAELLIQRGATLDLQTEPGVGMAYSGWENDQYGNTPLHLAAYYGLPALVDLLVERGASVQSLNRNGLHPLFAAVMGRQEECVARLLAAGSPIHVSAVVPLRFPLRLGNHQTQVEVNPVQWAAYESEHELLKRLLESGGSPYTRISPGTTLLHWAASRGDESMADLLLAAGAEVNALDAKGRTPLDRANPEAKALQSRLRASGGTNAIIPPRVAPSPAVPSRDGSPAAVDVEPPALFDMYPTVLGNFLRNNEVRVTGEVFGSHVLGENPIPNLREWILSLHPAPTADLTRVVRIRVDPQTRKQNRQTVDLTDPSADLEIKGSEEIFVPALPRKP